VALRDERGDPLDATAQASQQEWIKSVLDRYNSSLLGEPGEGGGVVVALRAEQDDGVGGRRPVVEGDEVGGPGRQPLDDDAVLAAPAQLVRVGLDEGDGDAGGAQGVPDGAADAAGADDVD
jgi:hypothetical protein